MRDHAGMSTLLDEVPALLREAAARCIAPRFRRLQQHDVQEKSPGELVTTVDREVEASLTPALRQLLPGSRVVGEEACAEQPHMLQQLGDGDVWLVDPLDGTANFVAGDPRISMLVTWLRGGEAVAAWMLDPLSGRLHSAELGGGAWIDGQRVHSDSSPAAADTLCGVVKTRYLPPDVKPRVEARVATLHRTLSGANCAGNDYPDIVAGRCDFVMYWRTLPWDHAPGVLFLQEAGGHAAHLDARPYRAAKAQPGLLAARTPEAWHVAHQLLWAD